MSGNLLMGQNSSASLGLKFRFAEFGPRVYLVYCAEGGDAGVLTTRIDDVLGCGKQDILRCVRKFPQRRVGGKDFEQVGLALRQSDDFPAQFANAVNAVPTTPSLWAPPQRHLSMEEILTDRHPYGRV